MEPFSTYAHVDVDYTDRTYDEASVNWYSDHDKDYTHIDKKYINDGTTITLPYIPNVTKPSEIDNIEIKGDFVKIHTPSKTKIAVKVHFYIVACHTVNNSSFYSKPFTDIDEATAAFTAYQDMADYFGGTVDLLAIYNDDYNVEDTYRSCD